MRAGVGEREQARGYAQIAIIGAKRDRRSWVECDIAIAATYIDRVDGQRRRCAIERDARRLEQHESIRRTRSRKTRWHQ